MALSKPSALSCSAEATRASGAQWYADSHREQQVVTVDRTRIRTQRSRIISMRLFTAGPGSQMQSLKSLRISGEFLNKFLRRRRPTPTKREIGSKRTAGRPEDPFALV